jgi:hypothetical protein
MRDAPDRTVLTGEEMQALMAAFLIGRRLGVVAQGGALGQLARRLVPDDALQRLAEAYREAGQGRFEAAAARIAALPLRQRGDAARRDEAVQKLRAYGRLAPGRGS